MLNLKLLNILSTLFRTDNYIAHIKNYHKDDYEKYTNLNENDKYLYFKKDNNKIITNYFNSSTSDIKFTINKNIIEIIIKEQLNNEEEEDDDDSLLRL